MSTHPIADRVKELREIVVEIPDTGTSAELLGATIRADFVKLWDALAESVSAIEDELAALRRDQSD